jgi:hypothetical protein
MGRVTAARLEEVPRADAGIMDDAGFSPVV